MIDFHTHILPGIDDGSNSAEESIELLNRLWAQGVDRVVATPHYSIRNQSDGEFLLARQNSLESLSPYITDDMPRIILGAEVEYFPGIGRSGFIKNLRVEGFELLLVEMPFERWSEKTVSDILELACSEGITPVLAHIERYFGFFDCDIINILNSNGVLAQMNCSALLKRSTRKKTLRLIDFGIIGFVGTDCHNSKERFPNMDSFVAYANKKNGNRFLSDFFERQDMLLEMNRLHD